MANIDSPSRPACDSVHAEPILRMTLMPLDAVPTHNCPSQSHASARTGDVVVALVGQDETADEATVKTFHREPTGRIRLQPENSALDPLYPEHVQILGKVTGVFRSLA